jgi:chromosome segregation ATPase
MTTGDSDHDTTDPPRKRTWMWISAALVVVSAGLLIWALTIRSDLDGTQEELANAQQELAGVQEELSGVQQELDGAKQDLAALESEPDGRLATGVALLSGKALYDEVAAELDATNEDLAATQEQLEAADKDAADAEQDAEAAKQAAADAGTETEKAKAQADQATADVKAATAALDCARAYISAFGALFEGESAEDQAPVVREQLAGITATCKDDLAGT